MKYCLLSILVSIVACNVNAQSNLNPTDRYKQKRLLDSLRNAHKYPAIIIIPNQVQAYNTPVMPITNEGEK